MAFQGYVSDKLTHLTNVAALVSILESGQIGIPISAGEADLEGLPPGVLIHPDWKPLRRDEFFRGDMVSFCDIPEKDLAIHAAKYGNAGIAFDKLELARRGANPVFYVDKQSTAFFEPPPWANGPLPEGHESTIPMSRWEGLVRVLPGLKAELHPEGLPDLDREEREQIRIREALFRVFEANVLGFLKRCDSSLPDEHPDNFYMEREWRLMGPVTFELEDVLFVYAPDPVVGHILDQYPELAGRVGPIPSDEVTSRHEPDA